MFELNQQQAAAVEHRGGPLLIEAGAGTGKTGTLAHRVAGLIRSGTPPARICLLTFTRRAAQEMLARAGELTHPAAAAQVWGGTFHAVAHRVLRLHGRHIGLPPVFSVLDQGDATEVLGLVRHDVLAVSPGGGRRFPRPDTLASIYGRVVCTAEPLADVVERDFPWCRSEVAGIREVFAGYTGRKRTRHLLDFEDLLLMWRALGACSPSLASGLWDQVLVDEYQDTNRIQIDILAGLRPGGAGLTAVGDAAQAIYAFRAATAGNMAAFPSQFPGATVIRLAENYRSIPPVLACANAVMAAAPPPMGPVLWSRRMGAARPRLRMCEDEAVQADAVCDSVLAHRDNGTLLQRQAVLFRASHHADALELALARRNIPYVKYGGLRILEAAHVKDLLALLRILDNPWDEVAWFRVLPLIEGVGPATARRVMADLGLPASSPGRAASARLDGAAGPVAAYGAPGVGGWADGDPAVSPLARLLAVPPRVPETGRVEMAGLRAALGDCAPDGEPPPMAAQVERLSRWLAPVVERRYSSPAARMADLVQLAHVAGRYPDRNRFIAELTLDPPAATGDLAGPPLLDEDWLVLSTVHSAKGGEWDVVHIIHAADGMFPSDMACGDEDGVEEERRLLYVAMTRARDVLEINVPLRYHVHRQAFRPSSDRHLYAQVSRFLTPEVRALMDTMHTASAARNGGAGDGGPGEGGPGVRTAGDGVAGDGGSGAARTDGMNLVDQFLSGLWA